MRLIIAGQEIALVPISSKKDAPEDIFKITFWIDPVQRAAFRNREHKGCILGSCFTSDEPPDEPPGRVPVSSHAINHAFTDFCQSLQLTQ